MKITIKKQIGSVSYEFEVEKDKDIDSLFEAGTFAQTPSECDLCKSSSVSLASNKNQGYAFVYVKCLDCGAKAQLGTYRDNGHFWKSFVKYEPKAEEQ